MATLTETAFYTRQAIKYGSVALVALFILRIAFGAFSAWWKQTHPPPPPPATVAFGKLPELPSNFQEYPNLKLKLETVSGTTGEFDSLGVVYFTPEKRSSLLALDRARELARKINFLFEPKAINETVYEWSKDNPFPTTLTIDTVSDHFELSGNWRVRPDLLSSVTIAPSEAEAISLAKNWLGALNYLPEDLRSGETKVSYFMVVGTEIVSAPSRSEAHFVKIDLFRAPVKDLKVWTRESKNGIASITFMPTVKRDTQQVVTNAKYDYNIVEYQQSATYPLINSQAAWKLLVEGGGYFAQVPKNLTEITVRKVSLGYFDSTETGFFLQPIFIFEGDKDFVGYVQAVDKAWIETNAAGTN